MVSANNTTPGGDAGIAGMSGMPGWKYERDGHECHDGAGHG